MRAEKSIYFICWMIKSLEDLGVLIDGVTKTVKHEIKEWEGGFLGALLAPFAFSSDFFSSKKYK